MKNTGWPSDVVAASQPGGMTPPLVPLNEPSIVALLFVEDVLLRRFEDELVSDDELVELRLDKGGGPGG